VRDRIQPLFNVFLVCLSFLSVLGGGPVLACRMLTLIQVQPDATVTEAYLLNDSRSLMKQSHDTEPYYELAGQSLNTNLLDGVVPNTNGVGILGFDLAGKFMPASYYRQSEPLEQKSSSFQTMVHKIAPEAQVIMAHTRAMTQGEITAQNNHPFKVALNTNVGGTWAFMANGSTIITPETYTQRVKDARLLKALSKAKTTTDSEKLFHILLTDALPLIDEPALAGTKPSTFNQMYTINALAEQLSKTYTAIQTTIAPGIYKPMDHPGYRLGSSPAAYDPESRFLRYWPKTWVMTNGSLTFIMVHGYDQWMQLRFTDKKLGAVAFSSEPTSIQEFYHRQQAPVPAVSRWQQIPNDTLIAIYPVENGQYLRMKFFPVVFRQAVYLDPTNNAAPLPESTLMR
jgi:predicted glutamine amidotransferase